MELDPNAVIRRLSLQLADVTVRLAVAETQLEAYQRDEVDRMAAQETDNADS